MLKTVYLPSVSELLSFSHAQALATSRSFGDAELKFPVQRRLVVATPDVKVVDLQPDDLFLILACDGIWDVSDIHTTTASVFELRRHHPTSILTVELRSLGSIQRRGRGRCARTCCQWPSRGRGKLNHELNLASLRVGCSPLICCGFVQCEGQVHCARSIQSGQWRQLDGHRDCF